MRAFSMSLVLNLPLAALLVLFPVGAALSATPDCSGGDCTAPQACQLTVPYLEALAPVVETAGSDVRQGDTFRVICEFRAATQTLDWQSCDSETQRNVERLRERMQISAGNRYSGMLDVNGVTVRVTASPPGGAGGFEFEHLWVNGDVGEISLVCKVDNMLQPYVEGSPRYLESTASLTAGPRVEGRAATGAADLPPRGQSGLARASVAGGKAAGSQLPAVQGQRGEANVVNRALNPQPEVPNPEPPDQRQTTVAGNSTVDRTLNPQPDVPNPEPPEQFTRDVQSAGQPVTSDVPTRQVQGIESPIQPSPPIVYYPGLGVDGGSGGSGSSAPSDDSSRQLSTGTSSPQARTGGPEQLLQEERLATAPEQVVLQKDSDQVQLIEPDSIPVPPAAVQISMPNSPIGGVPTLSTQASAPGNDTDSRQATGNPQSPQTQTGLSGQQTSTSGVGTNTRDKGQIATPPNTTNGGVVNSNPAVAGIEVGCTNDYGSVTMTNTTSQRLEPGTPARWAVYKKGSEFVISGWGAKWMPVEGTTVGEAILGSALRVGQQAIIGNFKGALPGSELEYDCRASVLPASPSGDSR